MAGIYGSDVFSQQPQPTGMGNKYRRNPASTRQNQIGNGSNPTGAQTVGQMHNQFTFGQLGQMQQAPGLQQTIGWQPTNTQQQLRAMTDMLARHRRSNVFGDTQAYTANGHLPQQQYPRPAQPQQPKTDAVRVLDRHLEGDDADEALQQQQYPQTPPPQQQQQTSNVYPLSNAAGAMVDTRSREPLDIADPSSQQARQQQQQALMSKGAESPQQQQQQTTEQALMSKGAENLTEGDWSTLVNRTLGSGAAAGDRNEFFKFVQDNSENWPKDIPDSQVLLKYILKQPAPTRQQSPLELDSNVSPQPRFRNQQEYEQQREKVELSNMFPQPPQRQPSAFSQALADSNVNPQQAATPRQRQMADMRNSASSTAADNSYAREIRIANEMGLDPEELGLSREGLKQQEQRPQSYADRAGTGRGQEFKLPPNQQLLARKQAMDLYAAQQEAAINGSPAYQRASKGRVKAFGSEELTDEENAKQQQNEAEQQQKYEDDLAGMRNDRANQEFRDGTPGGREMGRFAKLLAQRGQQPQQGQYQSNVEQPTKNSQDALERYYKDGETDTDGDGNNAKRFTNKATGQTMLIKQSDDGRYALTGKRRKTDADIAKIAADRQERLANASPALQKRAFDTARRRGQPRGNAVSNAMLRKQGMSPEQISNVYAGTQDKETTQLMRKPSTVGPAVKGPPTVASRAQARLDAETNYENSPALQQFGVLHDAGRNEYDTRFSALIDSNTEIDADMLSELQQQFSLASVADPEFLGEDGSAFDNEWDRFKNKHFQKFAIADTPEKQATWMSEYEAGKEKFGTVVKRAKASGERTRNPFGM